jgi:hypothetical protein
VDRATLGRLDEDKIMITFLEYEPLHLSVHDVVFLKFAGDWSTQEGAYKKLRVGTKRVVESLEQTEFPVVEARNGKGFSVVVVGQA